MPVWFEWSRLRKSFLWPIFAQIPPVYPLGLPIPFATLQKIYAPTLKFASHDRLWIQLDRFRVSAPSLKSGSLVEKTAFSQESLFVLHCLCPALHRRPLAISR